jgi:DNA-binding transcriptional ArsR family regulator
MENVIPLNTSFDEDIEGFVTPPGGLSVAEKKALATKRCRRKAYLHVEWNRVVDHLLAARADGRSRLLVALWHQSNLTRPKGGWFKLQARLLAELGLGGSRSNVGRLLGDLEGAGIVELQRRPGKRALVRLIDKPEEGQDV